MVIVAAATWASKGFGLFRERIPKGAISLEVTHRPFTDSAIHLSLIVIFSTTGLVLWSFEPARQSLTTIQQVKPITSVHIMILEQRRDVGQIFPIHGRGLMNAHWPLHWRLSQPIRNESIMSS